MKSRTKMKLACSVLAIFLLHQGEAAVVSGDDANGSLKVELSTGRVKGRKLRTRKGNEGIIFLGLPYAEAPVGKLKFSKPVPRKPWEGTFEATHWPDTCPQNTPDEPGVKVLFVCT